MPRTSLKSNFPDIARIKQDNASFCGPAVVQMLLTNVGITGVTQVEIVEKGHVTQKIEVDGMTVGELSKAVGNLNADCELWYKNQSDVFEVEKIVREYGYPVAVEWQGDFECDDDTEFENEDDDAGHYSIVTAIDVDKGKMLILDPYCPGKKDRELVVEEFEKRWWDTNKMYDESTGSGQDVIDRRVIFVVTPKDTDFPASLGMKKYENSLLF